jgi:hypothetical protein
MSGGDCRPTHSAVLRMQSLIIVTFSWSSDAAVMCFVIALHSFVVRSAFDSTFRLVVVKIYWRRVSNDGSYTCDGIPMDSLIKAAAPALAARATYVQAYPKPLDAPVMNQTL